MARGNRWKLNRNNTISTCVCPVCGFEMFVPRNSGKNENTDTLKICTASTVQWNRNSRK